MISNTDKKFFINYKTSLYKEEQNKQELFKKTADIISNWLGMPQPNIVLLNTEKDIKKLMRKDSRCSANYLINTIYINTYQYKNQYVLLSSIISGCAYLFLTHLLNKSIKSTENIEQKIKISKGFLNIVLLDKIYEENYKKQPYAYNVNSSQVFSECLTYIILNEIFSEIIDLNTDNLLISECIKHLDFAENDIPKVKEIYMSENIEDKSFLNLLKKKKIGKTFHVNLMNENIYDIECFNKLYDQMKKEYRNLKNAFV